MSSRLARCISKEFGRPPLYAISVHVLTYAGYRSNEPWNSPTKRESPNNYTHCLCTTSARCCIIQPTKFELLSSISRLLALSLVNPTYNHQLRPIIMGCKVPTTLLRPSTRILHLPVLVSIERIPFRPHPQAHQVLWAWEGLHTNGQGNQSILVYTTVHLQRAHQVRLRSNYDKARSIPQAKIPHPIHCTTTVLL
jgi:hypothetical protein